MREAILGFTAAALLATAGFVVAQTARHRTPVDSATTETAAAATDETPTYLSAYSRVAAADTSTATFKKLDTDHDGRISPLESAAIPRIAAAFTAGDKDRDGYLSREEFAALDRTAMAQP